MGQGFRHLLLLISACLIALVAGEELCRLDYQTLPVDPSPQVRYQPHRVRTFTLRPCQAGVYTLSAPASIDCSGLRINGHPLPSDPTTRILGLGDSFTFGLGVADDETWPARLEQLLNARQGTRTRVVNGGTVSYGAFQELDLLKEQLSVTHYDLVIQALYWNDYQDYHPPAPAAPSVLTDDGHFVWDAPPPAPWSIRWLEARSALVTVAADAFRRIRGDPPDKHTGYEQAYAAFVRGNLPAASWAPLDSFYTQVRALQARYHFGFLVVILPVVESPQDTVTRDSYIGFTTGLLTRLRIPFLNALTRWREHGYGADLFLPQGPDSHLNARGYDILARQLAGCLAQLTPAGAGTIGSPAKRQCS